MDVSYKTYSATFYTYLFKSEENFKSLGSLIVKILIKIFSLNSGLLPILTYHMISINRIVTIDLIEIQLILSQDTIDINCILFMLQTYDRLLRYN